jgi:hypothetical protein
MAAGPWVFPLAARTSLLNGDFDLNTNSFKIALYSSSWSAADSVGYTTTNELATANGYTQGGITIGAMALTGTTTVKVDNATSIVWTAAGGSIVARYAAIYATASKYLCYCLLDDAPADVTTTDTNTLTITMNASGIFTLA